MVDLRNFLFLIQLDLQSTAARASLLLVARPPAGDHDQAVTEFMAGRVPSGKLT